jgi:hypothetical protein
MVASDCGSGHQQRGTSTMSQRDLGNVLAEKSLLACLHRIPRGARPEV